MKQTQESAGYVASTYLQIDVSQGADINPRSWLGGYPKLPMSIKWPRSTADEGNRSLQFVAQICCEDLPHDLWEGAGPRHGWLAFFRTPPFDDDQGTMRAIHTDALGPERHPDDSPEGPYQEPLRHWPLRVLTATETKASSGHDATDYAIFGMMDSLVQTDQMPFDWPTAVCYVEAILGNLERRYPQTLPTSSSPRDNGVPYGETLLDRLVYIRKQRQQAYKRAKEIGPKLRWYHRVRFLRLAGESGLTMKNWNATRDKWVRRTSLREECKILFYPWFPNRRRYLAKEKKLQPHRNAAVDEARRLGREIRASSGTGKPFDEAALAMLHTFSNIEFYISGPARHRDYPVISLGKITDAGPLTDYADFLFFHIAEMFLKNEAALDAVPNGLLEKLKDRLKKLAQSNQLQMGGEPHRVQPDSYGLFDALEREKLIKQRKENPAERIETRITADDERFDDTNALLLQLPASTLLNSLHGTTYFISAQNDLEKGNLSRATMLIQSD